MLQTRPRTVAGLNLLAYPSHGETVFQLQWMDRAFPRDIAFAAVPALDSPRSIAQTLRGLWSVDNRYAMLAQIFSGKTQRYMIDLDMDPLHLAFLHKNEKDNVVVVNPGHVFHMVGGTPGEYWAVSAYTLCTMTFEELIAKLKSKFDPCAKEGRVFSHFTYDGGNQHFYPSSTMNAAFHERTIGLSFFLDAGSHIEVVYN